MMMMIGYDEEYGLVPVLKKNARIVGRLGSGPLLLGRMGSGVRLLSVFRIKFSVDFGSLVVFGNYKHPVYDI